MFEGFLTYGGMSVREIEAMTVGFDESMDMDIISQGPQFIKYCVDRLAEYGVPMITPGGGLKFVHEPKTLRFFTGRLVPTSDWPEKLTAAFAADFGEDQ